MGNVELENRNDSVFQKAEAGKSLATIGSRSREGRISPIDQRSSSGVPSSARLRSQAQLTSSEIRNKAKTLRERAVWDLREGGYRHREIGHVLGITRQRTSQIERDLVLRALASKSSRGHLDAGPTKTLHWPAKRRVRGIAVDDFTRRLDAINERYEQQLRQILSNGYNRQKSSARVKDGESTLFWKVWPLVERYELKPFSFSSLVGDFPSLSEQSHLAQLLSRLRRRGVLKKVGSMRIQGQNLPEIMMTQIPIEQFVAPKIEKLVAKWIRKLEQLKSGYCPNRVDRSIQSIRNDLYQRLLGEGWSESEVERAFNAAFPAKMLNKSLSDESRPNQPSSR
jgi:hypothetical protein